MFYDDVFKRITEGSPFSQKGILSVTSENVTEEYELSGIFCSGNYGQEDFDRGYSLKKQVKRQSFKISKSSLPDGLAQGDLARQRISIGSDVWTIDEVIGNDSGILELVLKA